MRLFNRYNFTNLASFAAAIIGTFLMWRFAFYASTRVDVPLLNSYGEPTGYTDSSMIWGTWTYLSSIATFVAVCALIVFVVMEIIEVTSPFVQRRIDIRKVVKRHGTQEQQVIGLSAGSFSANERAKNQRENVIEE